MHFSSRFHSFKNRVDFKQIPVHKIFGKSLDGVRFHHIKTVPSRH